MKVDGTWKVWRWKKKVGDGGCRLGRWKRERGEGSGWGGKGICRGRGRGGDLGVSEWANQSRRSRIRKACVESSAPKLRFAAFGLIGPALLSEDSRPSQSQPRITDLECHPSLPLIPATGRTGNLIRGVYGIQEEPGMSIDFFLACLIDMIINRPNQSCEAGVEAWPREITPTVWILQGDWSIR